jgi:hypothetical protein
MESLGVVALVVLGVELGCCIAVRLLHWRTGIFYSPRDAPRLSPACVAFLTQLVRAGGKGGVMRFSPALGWAPVENRRDSLGRPETNSLGIRSRSESAKMPDRGVVRVAAFGDCLTFGEGVAIEDSWVARLERLEPHLEVLNFGVDGYGLDQCYLRYLASLDAISGHSVVFITFVSSNIYKSLNVFRPFYAYDHDLKLTKPRFTLREGRLEAIPNPIQDVEGYAALLRQPDTELLRLGVLDVYQRGAYRRHRLDRLASVRLPRMVAHEVRKLRAVRDWNGRFVRGSQALAITVAIFDAFCARVQMECSQPIVVLLPTPEDIVRHRRNGTKPWAPLIEHFAATGTQCVDGLDVFSAASGLAAARECFNGRHLSPEAHSILARHLAALIRQVHPATMPAVAPPERAPATAAAPAVRNGMARNAR